MVGVVIGVGIGHHGLAQDGVKRSYAFGTVLNQKPFLLAIGGSVIPTARLRAEIFPAPWASVNAFYVSPRIMGFYPSDLAAKAGLGLRFHPFLYTIRKQKGERLRWLTINAFIGPSFYYQLRNSFSTLEQDGFLIKNDRLLWRRAWGGVVHSGVRLLYGGQAVGIELNFSLMVGYLAHEEFLFTSENTFVEQRVFQGYQKYIALGDFLVSLVYVLGKKCNDGAFQAF